MKEKGIKKLIKYLNEYDDGMVSWFEKYVEEFGVFILNTEQMMEEEIIISKSFGFIKWLVDNDKIDFDKLKPLTGVTEIMLATNYPNGIEVKRRYRLYEQLIMLLSIQDNPIGFLISILR